MIGMPNPPATTTGATPAWVRMTEAQWNTFTENTGTAAEALSAQYDAWNPLVLITEVCARVLLIASAVDGRLRRMIRAIAR